MVVARNCDIDLATRLGDGSGQFFRFVVSFCTPGDVVSITEGVDVENVDICRCEEEVLEERGEHVPRIKEHEGSDEVEDIRARHRYDQGQEKRVREEHAKSEVVVLLELGLHRLDGDEDGSEHEITKEGSVICVVEDFGRLTP